ncbi:TPM domain-containing protein [Neobacillus piezotolerans]|uniref:TPM domain-containing protein n=1 Tax=Neobacillus piezotolerans TaxID=2259171 RepID=A0A3D8GWG3_9BACI|nr:TPM domain-containing protein [Neobacillus piezotolerans]RDU38790.1 TPM domain-containing protein [Neobacillus piezotolerans]
MKTAKASALLALLVLFLLGGSSGAYAAGDKIPEPRGDIYVQDFADVLSQAEEQQLIGWGRQIEDSTGGAQVGVLTVNSLGGRDIQGYANEAFRKYKLGSAEKDNGVLLVLALKDKKIWIEVGYGLEGIIPDGKAGRILDTYAIPNLELGKPNQAVIKTYQAIGTEVISEETGGDPNSGQPSSEKSGGLPEWLIILLVVGFIIVDMVFFRGTFTFLLLSMIGRGGGGGGGGGPRGGGGGSSGGGGAGRGW